MGSKARKQGFLRLEREKDRLSLQNQQVLNCLTQWKKRSVQQYWDTCCEEMMDPQTPLWDAVGPCFTSCEASETVEMYQHNAIKLFGDLFFHYPEKLFTKMQWVLLDSGDHRSSFGHPGLVIQADQMFHSQIQLSQMIHSMTMLSTISHESLLQNGCFLGIYQSIGFVSCMPTNGQSKSFFFSLFPAIDQLPVWTTQSSSRCAIQYYTTWLQTIQHQHKHQLFGRFPVQLYPDRLHELVVSTYMFGLSLAGLRFIQSRIMPNFNSSIVSTDSLIPFLKHPILQDPKYSLSMQDVDFRIEKLNESLAFLAQENKNNQYKLFLK